jgi:prepilin-type N-terminal cleavage/methylation domain-containing protein
MKKSGFTLPEVLITLGIIGVVAALTMPALIASYQKQMLKTQFKKVYSVFSQNLQKTTMVDGSTGCYFMASDTNNYTMGADCVSFWEQFAKNLNVVKTCSTGGDSLAQGCIPQYTEFGVCGGTSEAGIKKLPAYVMNDGTILMPYTHNGTDTYLEPTFLFDVNGLKGPNKIGHDLFATTIMLNDGGYFINPKNLINCFPNASSGMVTVNDMMN